MIEATLTQFISASVRSATPLGYAALGELVTERSGVINVGLEGAIIAGAFGAVAGAGAGGLVAGFAVAAASGVAVAMVFALFVVSLRADQIITGTAISMLGLGLTGTLYQLAYGSAGAALGTPTIAPLPVPLLRELPVIGPGLFMQPITTYVLFLAAPLMAWWMYRTGAGLALRAVGENPAAAVAAGISATRVRWWAILFGGTMGGLSGAAIVLAQVGTFAEGMSDGRGYIAIAIVVLGRWRPMGVAGASLLFGAASAVKYLAQATEWSLPYELALAFPYLITLVALATLRGRARAPAALGKRIQAVS